MGYPIGVHWFGLYGISHLQLSSYPIQMKRQYPIRKVKWDTSMGQLFWAEHSFSSREWTHNLLWDIACHIAIFFEKFCFAISFLDSFFISAIFLLEFGRLPFSLSLYQNSGRRIVYWNQIQRCRSFGNALRINRQRQAFIPSRALPTPLWAIMPVKRILMQW